MCVRVYACVRVCVYVCVCVDVCVRVCGGAGAVLAVLHGGDLYIWLNC